MMTVTWTVTVITSSQTRSKDPPHLAISNKYRAAVRNIRATSFW